MVNYTIMGMILDMDGVLWKGDQPLVDLPATFAKLAEMRLRVILATNNATRSSRDYLEILAGFGVFLEAWQVINSGEAAALYLKERYPPNTHVYVVGEQGLADTLHEHGFEVKEQEARIVVAGLDRKFSYRKMRIAAHLIRNGCLFIGTNGDATLPTPSGLVPGAGAILASIQTASGVSPFIMGKPEPAMIQIALQRLGTPPGKTLAVGDRLETDIAGAQAVGLLSALVLSGVSSLSEVKAWKPAPNYIADDLTELLKLLFP